MRKWVFWELTSSNLSLTDRPRRRTCVTPKTWRLLRLSMSMCLHCSGRKCLRLQWSTKLNRRFLLEVSHSKRSLFRITRGRTATPSCPMWCHRMRTNSSRTSSSCSTTPMTLLSSWITTSRRRPLNRHRTALNFSSFEVGGRTLSPHLLISFCLYSQLQYI